jgi:hypothetical protein
LIINALQVFQPGGKMRKFSALALFLSILFCSGLLSAGELTPNQSTLKAYLSEKSDWEKTVEKGNFVSDAILGYEGSIQFTMESYWDDNILTFFYYLKTAAKGALDAIAVGGEQDKTKFFLKPDDPGQIRNMGDVYWMTFQLGMLERAFNGKVWAKAKKHFLRESYRGDAEFQISLFNDFSKYVKLISLVDGSDESSTLYLEVKSEVDDLNKDFEKRASGLKEYPTRSE